MQINSKQKINFSKLHPSALTILRDRKWEDQKIAEMSANEMFQEICHWHGVMDLDEELFLAKDFTVFKDICANEGIAKIASRLFSILSYLRHAYTHIGDDQTSCKLDISFKEFFAENPRTSTRLTNTILRAMADEHEAFPTVLEYWEDKNSAYRRICFIEGFGKKSTEELDRCILNFLKRNTGVEGDIKINHKRSTCSLSNGSEI